MALPAASLFFVVGAASVCSAIAMPALSWFVLGAPRRLAGDAAILEPGPRNVPAS
jgi:hypothetical protein